MSTDATIKIIIDEETFQDARKKLLTLERIANSIDVPDTKIAWLFYLFGVLTGAGLTSLVVSFLR